MKERYVSIKQKLSLIVGVVTLCLFFCVILLFAEGIRTNSTVKQGLAWQNNLTSYFSSLSEMSIAFHDYLYDQTDEKLEHYQELTVDLEREAADLADRFQSRNALDQYYMTLSLLDQADRIISDNDEAMHIDRLEIFDENVRLVSEKFTVLAKETESVLLSTYEFTTKITNRHFLLGSLLFVICLICTGFTRRLAQRLIRPIQHLTNAATRILEGEINVSCDFYGDNDEMRTCIEAFNRMVESLVEKVEVQRKKAELEQQLRIETEQVADIQEKLLKSQILVFQSRINPHFLFNTLNNVTQLAYIVDAPRTLSTSKLLGDYLRYALDTFDRQVTLTDELNNIETYIAIQQERYKNRIQFLVSYTKEGTDARIPSMVIEPLVENALVHGLKRCVADGEVKITVWCENEKIVIEVEDNGCGIEGDKLEILKQNMETDIPIRTGQSIGLHNVIHRLRLTFGEKFDWHIYSEPQQYTKVIFSFPYIPYRKEIMTE